MDIIVIILSIIILGIEIALHELGHFLTAKLFNVYCFEYSIGFGPTLYKRKKGETQFTLRAIPVGGYVSMYGESDAIPEDFTGPLPDEKRSLLKIKKWKRAIIMSAGIIVNSILALVLFMVSNAVPSIRVYNALDVAASGQAASLGLVEDDRLITPLDSKEIPILGGGSLKSYGTVTLFSGTSTEAEFETFFYISDYNNTEASNYFRLLPETITEIATGNEFYSPDEETTFDFEMTFAKGYDDEGNPVDIFTKTFVIGITYDTESKTYGYTGFDFSLKKAVVKESFSEILSSTGSDWINANSAVAKGIISLFTPKGINNVGGIVAVFQQTTSTFNNYGWSSFIYLWGFVSANLALFNLLPFPGLDGWHLFVIIVESITRREINPKVKNTISAIGMILLFGLIILITARDILRLF
ncbi:MAG: site-2 protease family protein [Bacilli bacterium]|jgi:regulator of sigma E protease|nr:site-2 protease family protein [Bacilli bacterium]MCH4235457.1 site-2 protease family protein [Bacilli bacterium]